MKKEMKLFLLVILAFTFFAGVIIFRSKELKKTVEAAVNTSVNIQSSPPAFKSGTYQYEDPGSSSISPTNEGSNIVIKATSEDPNDDNYYLVVCSTNSVLPNNSGAPNCEATRYCVSSSTADETEASCTFSTTGFSNESYDWFAFVCDAVNPQQCSSASQGNHTDSNRNSPFKVNHRPIFSAINDGGSVDPGANVTFTATSSDSDSDGSQDQVKVVVCTNTTTSVTLGSPSICNGGSLYCESGFSDSNPSCQYTQPAIYRDITRTVKGFVFDSHNFGAISSQTDGFTPNNIDPVVSNVSLNGGSDINLNDKNTNGGVKNIDLTADVYDANSCNDISTVYGYAYRSGVASCSSTDNNNCYFEVSCSVDSGVNSCTDDNDASVRYKCTVSFQYHADPTDADTTYSAQNWIGKAKAIDSTPSSNHEATSVGVEVNSLTAMTVTSAINYGSMSAGLDSGDVNQITTVTAIGNVGLDEKLFGTDMTYLTYEIPVENQKYNLSPFTYSLSGTSLGEDGGTGGVEVELNCKKTTITASPETKNTYWGILIPANVASGTYTGTVTVTAVKGEFVDW